jgi:hypothetical protein
MTVNFSRSNVASVLSRTNQALFMYWGRLATIERPPRKTALDPAQVRKILPNLVIYERKDITIFQIRLMGTKVAQRIGVDLTGKNLLDFFHYAGKAEAQQDLNRIVDEPCGQFLVVKDRFTSGREAWVEILRLPLTDDLGQTRFIIGCTEEKNTTGVAAHQRDKPELIAERIKGFFFDLEGKIVPDTIWTNPHHAVPDEVGGGW